VNTGTVIKEKEKRRGKNNRQKWQDSNNLPSVLSKGKLQKIT
jgi:hypothetical protein